MLVRQFLALLQFFSRTLKNKYHFVLLLRNSLLASEMMSMTIQKGNPTEPNKSHGMGALSKTYLIPGVYVMTGIDNIDIIIPYTANMFNLGYANDSTYVRIPK